MSSALRLRISASNSFAAHPGKLTVAPAAAARMLRALTLSLTHPMLADEPAEPVEIVDTLLHGIGTGIENT